MKGALRPLISPNGVIQVSKRKFPTLYASLERALVAWWKEREGWRRVVKLHREGRNEQADRLAKRLIGVEGPPMSEETKETLRRWKEEHKDEIAERRRMKAVVRKRTKSLAASGQLRRKR